MKKILILVFCTAFHLTRGGDIKYPVSAISEELKTGMYAVIREQSTIFNIYALNKTTQTERLVITILNKNGDRNAQMSVWYDKLRTVDYFRGVAYDAEGKVIKKLKQSEIYDRASVSGSALFDDNRIKIADLSQAKYPYTVEFEYQVEMKFLFFVPEFQLYEDDEVSAQKMEYKVIFPAAYPVRFKALKVGDPQKNVAEDGRQILTWIFENVRPEKFEKNAPDSYKVVPQILAAPDQFSYGGYEGRMDTWQNLGKWQILLNQGRDALPEKTVATIKELTGKLKTPEEKVKAVYEFLQAKTRYVGIQLGIGGFQPFEAKTVDEVGYGDCKALSNYTVSLLKAIGIKGYYTWIHGGSDNPPIVSEFVKDYFNHIVVAVPNGADTLWLECTSQTNPFGYTGRFTGDRKALMITELGGKLVDTPTYPEIKNIQSRSAVVTMEKTGDASATVNTTYSGLQYENGHLDVYMNLAADEQKKWLQQNVDIPTFDINSFSMINHRSRFPSGVVKADLALRRFATVSGKRLFLTPNLMNRLNFVPEKIEKRRTAIALRMGSVDFDTVRYKLPDELYPEFLPEPVKVHSRFGEYEASFKLDQGTVLYTRKLVIHKGEFPAESYNEFVEFFKNIGKADNIKLVFLNKT